MFEGFILPESMCRVVQMRENAVLSPELLRVFLERLQERGVRIQRRGSLQVAVLSDPLLHIGYFLVEQPYDQSGRVFVGLVTDNVMRHTAPVVNSLLFPVIGHPCVRRSRVYVVPGLGYHLVVHSLERSVVSRRVDANVVRGVPRETLSLDVGPVQRPCGIHLGGSELLGADCPLGGQVGDVRGRRSLVAVHVDVGDRVLLGELQETAVGVQATGSLGRGFETLERLQGTRVGEGTLKRGQFQLGTVRISHFITHFYFCYIL